MSEHVLRAEIAAHAEQAARHWAANRNDSEPQCPYAPGTEACHAWRACFQRYLVLYSAVHGETEEQSA